MNKRKWTILAKATLAVGLWAGKSQAMETALSCESTLTTHKDILAVIHTHLEDPKTEFQLVCKIWQNVINDHYHSLNKNLSYSIWSEASVDLSPRLIFLSNDLYQRVLKCHINTIPLPLFTEKCSKLFSFANQYLLPNSQTLKKFKAIEKHGPHAYQDQFLHQLNGYREKTEFLSYLRGYDDCLPLLLAAIDKYGNLANPEFFYKVACKLSDLKKYDEAIYYALLFIEKNGDKTANYQYSFFGRLFYEAKKYDESAKYHLISLNRFQNETLIFQNVDEDSISEDSASIDIPLKNSHELVVLDMFIDYYIEPCRSLRKAGRHHEITPLLIEATKLTNKNLDDCVWSLYGFLCQSNQYDQAQNYLKKVIESNEPPISTGYAAEMFFCLTKLGRHEAAEEYKTLAILNADDRQCFADIANAFYKLGQYENSILYLTKAIEVNDEEDELNDQFYCDLAKTYTKLGNYERADHFIRMAIEGSVTKWNNKMIFDDIVKFLTKADRLDHVDKVRQMSIDFCS